MRDCRGRKRRPPDKIICYPGAVSFTSWLETRTPFPPEPQCLPWVSVVSIRSLTDPRAQGSLPTLYCSWLGRDLQLPLLGCAPDTLVLGAIAATLVSEGIPTLLSHLLVVPPHPHHPCFLLGPSGKDLITFIHVP